MFRRNRNGPRWFTRQVSGALSATAPSAAAQPILVADGLLFSPEAAVAEAATHMVKQVDISAVSWTSDYVQTTGDANFTDQPGQFSHFGAEALYVDQLKSDGTAVHAGEAFLNLASVFSTVELDDMPLRIVHRRRFTIPLVSMNTTSPTVGTNFGANVAYITAGFGTERHIRRRIRLRPNEALVWRVEFYDLPATNTVEGSELFQFIGDILATISYRVVT